MDIDVGYEANDSGLKHSSPVYGVSIILFFISQGKAELKLFFM